MVSSILSLFAFQRRSFVESLCFRAHQGGIPFTCIKFRMKFSKLHYFKFFNGFWRRRGAAISNPFDHRAKYSPQMALSVASCNKTKTAKGFLAPLPLASGRGVFFFWKNITNLLTVHWQLAYILAPVFSGGVAQLVRALPCHGRGCGFESRRSRHFFKWQVSHG